MATKPDAVLASSEIMRHFAVLSRTAELGLPRSFNDLSILLSIVLGPAIAPDSTRLSRIIVSRADVKLIYLSSLGLPRVIRSPILMRWQLIREPNPR
jgi:hypothetical protein